MVAAQELVNEVKAFHARLDARVATSGASSGTTRARDERRRKRENLPLWLMQNNLYSAPTLFGEAYVQQADAGGFLTRMGTEVRSFGLKIDKSLGGYHHTGNAKW